MSKGKHTYFDVLLLDEYAHVYNQKVLFYSDQCYDPHF